MVSSLIAARSPTIAARLVSAEGRAGRTIRVLRMGRSVHERFRAAPREAGQVHSAYAKTLNLLWHDHRLLTLHGRGPLLAPFAAAVTHLPVGLAPGTCVWRESEGIRLGPFLLTWEGGAAVDTGLQPGRGSPRLLAAVLKDRVGERAALGLLSPRGRVAQRRLGDGIRGRDSAAFVEGGSALIGLGEGLTPAGDDCLVGALAVLWCWRAAWLQEHQEIRRTLAAVSGTRTTTIGREFLFHALDGSFSEAIASLMNARSATEAAERADALAGMGASSGADTLRGMNLALEAICP
jgi:hypothetical protein